MQELCALRFDKTSIRFYERGSVFISEVLKLGIQMIIGQAEGQLQNKQEFRFSRSFVQEILNLFLINDRRQIVESFGLFDQKKHTNERVLVSPAKSNKLRWYQLAFLRGEFIET
ncbi:hypothetical protein ACTXT7_012362 [Hymenolepis weldensis]